MKSRKPPVLIVSFDAVGDAQFERLTSYPVIAAFMKHATVVRDVSSVFLSNTYPIHTSVATGVAPQQHGVISNTEPFPSRHPFWITRESDIQAKTLWQVAAERGIKTATVFWPVTAGSSTICYNIPEVMARPGKSQIFTSLNAGSKLLQLKLFLRHRKLLDGIRQPNLDNFATACAVDILREHRPGLMLVHFTVYDALCHKNGLGSASINEAFKALDRNFARLLKAAGDDAQVLVFSDHAQLNVHTTLDPNQWLLDRRLLHWCDDSYMLGGNACFIESCGGSAFFHAGTLPTERIHEFQRECVQQTSVRRLLTRDELQESGRAELAFGFCAQPGYCFEAYAPTYAATHGYPLDMPDYKVFYAMRGFDGGRTPPQGGSLLDIAPLVARQLNISL